MFFGETSVDFVVFMFHGTGSQLPIILLVGGWSSRNFSLLVIDLGVESLYGQLKLGLIRRIGHRELRLPVI
jgi:hypothetical protein